MHSVSVSYLTQLKERSGLTLQQISDQSGVPLPTVKRIFSGNTDSPCITTLADIVDTMGGSLDTLCGIKRDTAEMPVIRTEMGLKDIYDIALASSRESFENAYRHELEHCQAKDKWIFRMFVYCVAMTFIYAILTVVK